MDEQQAVRVLFQLSLGVPFQSAPDEAKRQALDEWRETFRRWKASGVRLIGTFSTFGSPPGGYAHTFLLEVPHIDMLQVLNGDSMVGTKGRLQEAHCFTVGTPGLVTDW